MSSEGTQRNVIECRNCGCEVDFHQQNCPVCGKALRPEDEGRMTEAQIKKTRRILNIILWTVAIAAVIWRLSTIIKA